MEQYIKILEEYINFKKQFTLLDDEQERLEALEHLIKAYKELKEEYSNEQKSELLAYKELQEKNLELEKEKKQIFNKSYR